MTRKKAERPATPGRYMTLDEVAAELGLSRNAIYTKIYDGQFQAVPIHKNGKGLRVVRTSFDEYCARIEREAADRFGGAA